MLEFKIKDASSYDAVALSFARFSDIVTKPLAETIVRLAQLGPQDQVLDIGTGSGIVAMTAAERINAPGSVTGVDLSDGLLAIAQERASQADPGNRVRFERADAEALPFPDQSFDSVLSLFALLHFPNPEKAVSEMYRVLRPGRSLVIGIGSGPPWRSVQGWFHRLGRIPDLILLKTGKLLLAPAHLNQLVEQHLRAGCEPEETDLARSASRTLRATALLSGAGLRIRRTYWQGHHLAINTAQEFWELQSTFSSIARKRLQSAAPDQIEFLRGKFQEQCQQVLARGGKLVYHYSAFYIVGSRE